LVSFISFYLGYIGHMLPDNLEIAYMLLSLLYMLGYFVNYVSGIILDVQGMQYLIVVSLVAGLPPHLLCEWMHKAHIGLEVKDFIYLSCK